MPKLTPLEAQAWRGLLQTHQRLWNTLDRELQDETGLNLAAYELLLTLEEGPDTGLRMTELAHALGYSLGGLTRLADKLQALNLITRERCETDGRGYQVTLTPHGAQRLKRLHVTHLKRVRALFLNRVTPEEQQVLASIWTRLQEEPA